MSKNIDSSFKAYPKEVYQKSVKQNSLQKHKNSQARLKTLVCAAIFVAISIILGKYLPIFNISILRISLENLPLIMSGIMFGPVIGAMCGALADLLGCFLVGYEINPLVLFGGIAVGGLSGLVYKFVFIKNLAVRIISAAAIAHFVGSVVIKSVGLVAHYDLPLWELMLVRLVSYTAIAAAEFTIIYILLKNKAVNREIDKMKIKKVQKNLSKCEQSQHEQPQQEPPQDKQSQNDPRGNL